VSDEWNERDPHAAGRPASESRLRHHFRFGIVFLDGRVVCIDLGLRFRDRRARFNRAIMPRDAAARVARFSATLFHTGFYRKKNACLGREKTKKQEAGRQRIFLWIPFMRYHDPECLDRIEILPPEGVGQDNDVRLQVRFFIGEVAGRSPGLHQVS